jgi:hypothetical protein
MVSPVPRRTVATFQRTDRFGVTGGTRLGVLPVPPFEDILAVAEFVPTWIDRIEFEKAWQLARGVAES